MWLQLINSKNLDVQMLNLNHVVYIQAITLSNVYSIDYYTDVGGIITESFDTEKERKDRYEMLCNHLFQE